MAGNTIYVKGSYIDIHDNGVVNLSVDKGEVHVGDRQQSKPQCAVGEELVDSEPWLKVKQAARDAEETAEGGSVVGLTHP